MSVNNHNQNNSPGINNNSGHVKATPRLPPRSNVAEGFASGNQNDILTFETAPRSNEKITEPQAVINANGAESDLSYHFPTNSNSNTSLYPYYTGSEVDPINGNTSTSQYNDRPEANPYFLFFGKFSSTLVQNMKPNLVGHYDVSGGTVNQQPSNIYNIPDYPKDYTMFKSAMTSYNTGSNDPLNEQNIMDEFTTDKIIYDASSCPVNWRMFGPIQRQVIDWSNNGITGGGGGGSGGSGTGTDISFNDYFFKQPEMPLDCSFNFIPGTSTTNDTLRIHWDKPFNRKTGSSYLQTGHRYFYEKLNPVENWLPQFTELILDISGGANNRRFCKDSFGNFVHEYDVGQGNGGVLDNTVQKYKAYAFLSANNTAINLEATTSPSINNITVQYGANAAYGNMETTIIDHFTPNNTTGNYAGGNPRLNDIALGSTYDIAVYYRNNTKINTDPSLSPNDLYYNKHNVCLLKNIIFGIPGFPEPATGIDFWNDSATERYYLGGIGPVNKDSQNASPPGMGLNLPWTNTSIIKVGYDCSLNMTYNSGSATTHRVQIGGANSQSNNLVFNNFPILYNLDAAYVPINMADTKRNWPVGGNSSNSGAPSPLEDYIKMIDIAAGGNGRDHPEFKYEITKYNVINDTIDDTLIPPDIRKVPFSPLPITRVLPIMSRNSCNLTGFTEYENVMPAKAETPTSSSFDFLEMKKLIKTTTGGSTTVSQVNVNAQRSRSRKTPTLYNNRQEYTDTIFLAPYSTVGGVTTKESFCLTSGNKVFKQLANFGEPKTGIITGQTYGDLIEPSAYLGSSMASAAFISQVELDFQTDQGNPTQGLNWSGNFQTALIPNTADLVGWDTTFSLLPAQGNLSNVAQTISHNQGAHDFKFSVSPTFDIAETDPEITFSNKRGYYLGFDISNVMIDMDIHFVPASGQGANPYKDSALLAPSYRQHRVTLNHKVAKRNTGTPAPSLSQFVFRFATKPDDITVSNITFSNNEQGPIIPGNSMDFTDFFGVKRLPPASSNTNLQFGGVGLELRVQFDLNNISENWIPHTSDTDSNDNIAYIEFVVGPGAFPAVNASGDLISLKKDRVSWTDTRIGTTGTTKQIRSFLEISEALTSLSVDSGSSTYLYSRKATDIGEPLFGLKNHKFYYSNNVTRNNISIEGLSLAGRSDGFTTLQECEDFSRFVPNLNPNAPRKELFWDYTFPIHSPNQINQELPSDIDNNLKLLHIYSGTSGIGTSHNSTTLPWGGTQYDLIDLDALLNAQPAAVGFNTWYKHNMILPDEQSMWCNGSFVGPVSNLPLIEDPYINYTNYFNSGGQNYSSKKTTGIAVPLSGTMNISGSNNVSTSVSTLTQFPSKTVKWLLFEVTSLPGLVAPNVAKDFSVNLQQKTGQVYSDLVLGTDYHMFYCERDAAGATTTSYQITVSAGAPKVPLSWSTWLNCLVAKGNTGPTSINAIDYANGLPAPGSGNGCNSRGAGNNFLIKPTCKGFQTNTNMRKFLLIGLFEDTKCSKITIS